ncbi:MAG: endo-1,4-beta-xylanase [Candidatus Hodarchaeota archaeon]
MRKIKLDKNKAGILIFVLLVASFGFLLITPYVPNYFGQLLDDQYLRDAENQIQSVRKGPIRIKIINGTDNSSVPGMSVAYNHTRHEFLFGAMFFHYKVGDPWTDNYTALWKDVFNYAILPFYYAMYDTPTEMNPKDEPNRDPAIEFCMNHSITMKGHPLMWNHEAGVPPWLDPSSDYTNQEIIDDMQEHINTIVGNYSDKIQYWDVTNEIVHRGVYNDIPVDWFVDKCYEWARNASPSANLVFNEYGMLGHDFGNGDVARYLQDMNGRGTQYDRIGMQAHAMDTDWIPTYEIKATLDGFQGFGKPIQITELMVPSTPVPITNSWKKGLWSEENQAEFLRRLYTVCFAHPAVEAIVYWGFEESSHHRNDGYGLLDNDLTPRASYNVLKQLIKEEWHTEGTRLTDAQGWMEFEGFFGNYTVTVNSVDYNITASSTGNNVFTIYV